MGCILEDSLNISTFCFGMMVSDKSREFQIFILIHLELENYSICLLGYQKVSRRHYMCLKTPGKSKVNGQGCSTKMEIIFWDFLILYQNFFSPQVKRSVFISNKHGRYELAHKLPNNLRLTILENQERSGKSQNFKEL